MPILYEKRTEGNKTTLIFSRRRRNVFVGVGILSIAIFWSGSILGQSSPYFYPVLLTGLSMMVAVALIGLIVSISAVRDRMSAGSRVSRRKDEENDILTIER